MRTVWVLGDQLNRDLGAMSTAEPHDTRVLLVESDAKLRSKRWHVQRLHLVIAGMRRFADELRTEGFAVDHRRAPSLRSGLRAHREEHRPTSVVAMEPASWDGVALLRDEAVETIPSDQFLCHHEVFAEWAADRGQPSRCWEHSTPAPSRRGLTSPDLVGGKPSYDGPDERRGELHQIPLFGIARARARGAPA
jgi:deoxyribodipyrimidine photolyase-like uncharacterized protein